MKTISLVLKELVSKLEQEINNDIDMNVETEQFISTDTYVGQTEQFYGLKIFYNERLKYEVILKPDMWRIFYPNQRRIATNYRTVDEYSPQRIKNYIKSDMSK